MAEDLEAFLRQRGVESLLIQRIIDDKIDCNVIVLMDDDTLKTYLPAYGDRVAAYAFCKTKTSDSSANTCTNALSELRSKWKNDRRGPSGRSGFKPGNSSAERSSRRVELGWMDYNEKSKEYKQVRQTGGGGVRHLNVSKSLPVHTLLGHAKDTFFPSGVSKRGLVDEFDIVIRNFQGMPIEANMTINNLYVESKLKILRVYMYTTKKMEKGPGLPGLMSRADECETQSDNESLPDLMADVLHSAMDSSFVDADTPTVQFRQRSLTTEPTRPTAVLQTIEPTRPTAVLQTIEPTRPTAVLQTTEPTRPTAVLQTIEPTRPTALLQTTEPTRPTAVLQTTEPTRPTAVLQTTEPTRPTAVLQTTEPTRPTAVLQTTEPTRPTALLQTTEPTCPTSATTGPAQRSSRLSLHRQSGTTATASCDSRQSTCAFEVIDVSDSEDEEVALAIEASLASAGQTKERGEDTGRDVGCILKAFRDRYVEAGQTRCVIFRAQPLKSAIRTLERNINLKQILYVKFSGEMGEDQGGPRREFFRLALSELHHSEYFEGVDGSKIFSHNLNLVEKQSYKTIGRLVALSLVQDGPGVHFLNQQLFNLMVGHDSNTTPVHEIISEDIRDCLDGLENVSTPEERDKFLVNYGDWLADRGINAYRMQGSF